MAGIQTLCPASVDAHGLLPPATVLERELLQRHLIRGATDPLAVEELAVSLLSASLRAAQKDRRREEHARHASTALRRKRQVEIVKELISLHPAREWTLGALAHEAAVSPYHLARVFREDVGVPVHQYLVRTRISKALKAMRAADADLAGIALESGFSHHSHFTKSFREIFGMTPSRFRAKDCWPARQ